MSTRRQPTEAVGRVDRDRSAIDSIKQQGEPVRIRTATGRSRFNLEGTSIGARRRTRHRELDPCRAAGGNLYLSRVLARDLTVRCYPRESDRVEPRGESRQAARSVYRDGTPVDSIDHEGETVGIGAATTGGR